MEEAVRVSVNVEHKAPKELCKYDANGVGLNAAQKRFCRSLVREKITPPWAGDQERTYLHVLRESSYLCDSLSPPTYLVTTVLTRNTNDFTVTAADFELCIAEIS